MLPTRRCWRHCGKNIKHVTERAAERLRDLPFKCEDLRDEEMLWVRRRLLFAEKDEVINAFQHSILSETTYKQLLADTDTRLLQLETGEKRTRATPTESHPT